MLGNLNKGNKKDYVTKEELHELLQIVTNSKFIKGNPGKDATITKTLIDKISKMVKPIKGLDYRDGADGTNYELTDLDKKDIADIASYMVRDSRKNEFIVSDEDFSKKLQSLKGDLRPRMDNIKGLKTYLNRVNDLSKGFVNLSDGHTEFFEALDELREQVNGFSVQIAQGGSGDCTCPTPAPSTCNFTDPSGDGVQGEQWFNESTSTLFTWLCGQWYSQVMTPFAPLQPEAFITEDDEMILTEDGFAIVIE